MIAAGALRAAGGDLAPGRLGGLRRVGGRSEPESSRRRARSNAARSPSHGFDVALEVEVGRAMSRRQRLGAARRSSRRDRRVGGHDLRRRVAAAAGE